MSERELKEKTAFAVFSASDDSLRFYKRHEVPKSHDVLDGREADEVYLEDSFRLAPWLSEADCIETVKVVDEGIAPATTSLWFSGFEALERCDLSRLDTSNVVDMSYMFAGCDSLAELDLSSFDTSKVTAMSAMFSGCKSLETLNILGFDASRVRKLNRMFDGCERLRRIDMPRLAHSMSLDMERAFAGCKSLEELDIDLSALSKWTSSDDMLEGCSSLPAEKVEEIKRALQERLSEKQQEQNAPAFAAYSAADRTLRLYKRAQVPMVGEVFDGRRANEVFLNVENDAELEGWGHLSDAVEAVVAVDEGIAPDSMGGWFARFTNLKSADLSKLAPRWPCSMEGMFSGCESLSRAAVAGPLASSVSHMFSGCSSLTQVDLSGLDVSGVADMSSMFEGCSSLAELDLSNLDVAQIEDMSSMFEGCSSLAVLDLSSLRTANLNNMRCMFKGCDSLEMLNLSGFDFSGIIDSDRMFEGCDSLRSVTYSDADKAFAVYTDVDKTLRFYRRPTPPRRGDMFEGRTVSEVIWGVQGEPSSRSGYGVPWDRLVRDIEAVEVVDEGIAPISTSGWFSECANMVSCDLARLDVSKVANMSSMFDGCSSLESLDISGFAAAKPRDLSSMFSGCVKLAEIDLAVLDTGNVEDMKYMFSGCKSLRGIDLSVLDTSKVTDMSGMFWGCDSLVEVNLAGIDTSNVLDMSWMFAECYSLGEIELSGLDTSRVAFMNHMFSQCEQTYRIGLSGIDTSNVRDMSGMFAGCSALTDLDLSGFDTYLVRDARGMLCDCSGLKRLDLSSFGTSSMEHMGCMFSRCASLDTLDLSSFDTRRVRDMNELFDGCENLKRIDLSGLETGNAEYMDSMFSGCKSLRSLDLSGFDTSKVKDIRGMFCGCESLAELDFPGLDTSSAPIAYDMFYGCSSLPAETVRAIEAKMAGSVADRAEESSQEKRPFAVYSTGEDHTTQPTGSKKNMEEPSAAPGAVPVEAETSATIGSLLARGRDAMLAAGKNLFSALSPSEKRAFAVYSDADKSLRFYRRDEVPQTGEEFEGRMVDEVFAGDEFAAHRWFVLADDIKTVEVVDEGIAPASTASWFHGFENMTSADLSRLDTGGVKSMDSMFAGCRALTSLDLSGFDTSRVLDMGYMFDGCSSLKELDLSGFDASRVKYMNGIFRRCSALESLDLSGFATGNVEALRSMFYGCSSLADLDLSGINTTRVTDMQCMFCGCSSLETLDISGFDTTRVWSMHGMFSGCPSLVELDLSGFDTGNVHDMSWMFSGSPSLVELDLSSFDTSSVELMDGMFAGCSSLTELDLSGFDTDNVFDMGRMFEGCVALEHLDLSSFDASRVEYMNEMFSGCDSLPAETVRAFEKKVAEQMPLYYVSQGAPDLSIAALELRAQGFPGDEAGWAMRTPDGRVITSSRLEALFEGSDVISIAEVEGIMVATLSEGGERFEAEIRLSPSAAADWEECESPHVALWAAGSGATMQWAVGACPNEAELAPAEPGGRVLAFAKAEVGGTWSATVADAGREVVRAGGLASADEARRACEMGAFRLGGAICSDSAAQFAEVSAKIKAAAAGTLADLASAPGIDGEALLADWTRESRGADPEKTPAIRAVEALGPLSAYARENPRPAVQDAGRTVEAVRAGAASAGIPQAEALGAARAASVDAAVSMMAKGADGFAVVYRDLAFAPAADGTWTVMKQSAEGSFSLFEAGWRPGALSFDEQAACADVAKMEAATPAECNAGGWRDAGAQAAQAPAKAACAKHAPAPAKTDPAMLVAADAPGSSARGAR